ncbi:MAG: cytidine deaminase [Treponema sp.]|nr:cytidine deaminase [Treponema sp.]
MNEVRLIEKAFEMLKFSYCPYSHFHVGAALLSKSGKIYGGCNVENAAYGPSNCAERTAIFKAVSEGEKEFDAICIAGGMNGEVKDFCPPCGVCRQVMREFCSPDFKIILAKSKDEYKIYTLEQLLPESFTL